MHPLCWCVYTFLRVGVQRLKSQLPQCNFGGSRQFGQPRKEQPGSHFGKSLSFHIVLQFSRFRYLRLFGICYVTSMREVFIVLHIDVTLGSFHIKRPSHFGDHLHCVRKNVCLFSVDKNTELPKYYIERNYWSRGCLELPRMSSG